MRLFFFVRSLSAVSVAAIVPLACAETAPFGQKAADVPGAAAAAPAAEPAAGRGEFADADALLTALEKADEGLSTFDASIVYDRRFELQGDRHIRRGKMYFRSELVPLVSVAAKGEEPGVGAMVRKRSFAVKLTSLQIDDVVRSEEQTFIFDGEWFIDKNDAAKRFIKRQVALPGQAVDPLKLGEGPFPIPIGQKKSDILSRYDAKLVPVAEGLENEPQLAGDFIAGSQQLVLTPKVERADDDEFKEIHLWYRKDSADGRLLPRLARTINKQGDESFVQLVGIKVNAPDFPKDAVSVKEPSKDEGWDVQIELKRMSTEAAQPAHE